ncbi:secondary thiamine-phosphate synthase enzyme YjbQ [Agaribacter flavus]|uniref:Secondary thiamine-phosphate synthase enzyme YjbQ n=1 Tax=Agaribacter flavus TaxID=1902781 RepID=A0ABV7FL69_9ALTE
MIRHYKITLPPFQRGFHLITEKIIDAVGDIPDQGILNVFIQHTSASLSINENADPTVRQDFESHFNVMVPEDAHYYIHTYEGSDDMPAHLKTSLLGSSVSVPIIDGRLALGTWQGIYLGEHRNHGGARRLIISVYQ